MAGVYNLNILDATGNLKIKQKKICSTQIVLTGSKFFFFDGTTGKWALKSIDITNWSEKIMFTFDDLTEAALTEDYAVYRTAAVL